MICNLCVLLSQLTEGASSCSSADQPETNDRERAIRLLRESLTDARVALTRSLTMSFDNSVAKEPAYDVVWSRSMESVLERYSERLSSRALQAFKEKLDEQIHPAITKM